MAEETAPEKPKPKKAKAEKPKKREGSPAEMEIVDSEDESAAKSAKPKGKKEAAEPKKKKAKDPNAPKKSMTSYMLWQAATRDAIKAENPGVPQQELMKIMSQKWKDLSEDDRETWKTKAASEFVSYKQRVKDYEASHPAPAAAAADSSDEDAKKKKTKKDPNEPKRPMSSYFLWTAANRQKLKDEFPGLSITDFSKKAGELWKKVTEEEKKEFELKSQQLKAQYDLDMEEYRKTHPKVVEPKKQAAAKKPKTPSRQQQLNFKSEEFVGSDSN